MTSLTLTRTRIQSGIYEGLLQVADTQAETPRLEAKYQNVAIGEVELTKDPERAEIFSVRFVLPSNVMTEGVQTVVLTDAATDEALDSFSILTGQPVDDDLKGEVSLLRAELDMLKKAFRRHCLETSQD